MLPLRVTSMKNFRQADSRWGNLPYAHLPYKMATNGCGATSCADIVVSNPKFKKYTPKQTRLFMLNHHYVVDGSGTAWAGIPACLRWYGFKISQHGAIKDLFKEMAKGKRRAILLFRGGSRNGVTWTTGGHFVAVSGYKVVNGKHYLYTLDPGFRHNDGWHCYETTMKGLIVACWTCYLPAKKDAPKKQTKPAEKKPAAKKPAEKKPATKKPTTKKPAAKPTAQKPSEKKPAKKRVYPELPKRGYFIVGDKGVNVKRLQVLLNKAKYNVGKADGIYGAKTAQAVKRLQQKYKLTPDGIAGRKTVNALKKALK